MGSELRRLSTSVSRRTVTTVPVWRACRPVATTTRTRSPAARGCALIEATGANESSAATAAIGVRCLRDDLRFGGQPNVGGGGRASLERQRTRVEVRRRAVEPSSSLRDTSHPQRVLF
jgi:hypothetical protein